MRSLCGVVLVTALVAMFVGGCGSSKKPAGSAQPPKQKKPPAPIPQPTVKADAFASIPEAVAKLREDAAASNREGWYEASQWLQMQKGAAVAPLQELLNDDQADIRAHIVAVRTLSGLGSAAEPVLLATLRSHPSEKVQLNAIDQIGYLKPPSQTTIDELIGLLDHENDEFRRSAAVSLGAIGEPAAAAGDKLVAILNSTEENDHLRSAAKNALKKVNPRKTFRD